VRRQVVEFERFHMGQRPGRREAGNVRDCRVRSEIEEDLLTGQQARAAVVESLRYRATYPRSLGRGLRARAFRG
jgi:hypothetical protein